MNLFSQFTFWWVNPLLKTGYKKPLDSEDLLQLPDEYNANQLSDRFEQVYNQFKCNGSNKPKNHHGFEIWRTVHRLYGFWYYMTGLYLVMRTALQFATPFLLSAVIRFVENSQDKSTNAPSIWYGLALVMGLFGAQVFSSLFLHQYTYITCKYWAKCQLALTSAVFKKTMNLTPVAKKQFETGQLINYMCNDAVKVGEFACDFHIILQVPVILLGAIGIIYKYFGVSTFAGLFGMIIFSLLLGSVGKRLSSIEEKRAVIKDERVKIMSEMLRSIRIVKFFSLEQKFEDAVTDVRSTEQRELRKSSIAIACQTFLAKLTTIVGCILTFSVYALLGGKLTSQNVFTSIAAFNLMNWPMNYIPFLMTSSSSAYVSAKRLNNFLYSAELRSDEKEESDSEIQEEAVQFTEMPSTGLLDESALYYDANKDIELVESAQTPEMYYVPTDGQSIVTRSLSSKWDADGKSILHDVNLEIKKGSLVAITGRTGSGKSSLFHTILGTMARKGYLATTGSLSYCDQTPWIINASLRDNILFGQEYEDYKYRNVVAKCQLEHDIERLGDSESELGENGANLSGGQKMRIALARTIYRDADIYLLDSIFAPVDPRVQNSIFEECIKTYLAGKTRLIITHSMQILTQCDQVIVLDEGTVKAQGKMQDLLTKFDFKSFLSTDDEEVEEEAQEEIPAFMQSTPMTPAIETRQEITATESQTKVKVTTKMVETEERNAGDISPEVWKFYFLGYGKLVLVACILIGIISKSLEFATTSWLSIWSAGKIPGHGTSFYLYIYMTLGLFTCLILFVQSLTFAMGNLRSANSIHSKMLRAVLRAPILFFDQNPSGRVLNRFAKDQATIDIDMLFVFELFYASILNCIGVIISIAVITPLFLILVAPCLAIFYFVQKYYRKTSREVRRLESFSLSPLLSHFNACINGKTTIRAFEAMSLFNEQNSRHANFYMKHLWSRYVMNRWLGVRLEFIGSLIVLGASFFGVIGRYQVSAAFIGLSISNSLVITDSFISIVRLLVDAESNLTSCERALKYCKLESEGPFVVEDESPSERWPTRGEVKFDNFSMRYRKDVDPVLRNITITIQPGEKVGIVGRTGAGKSSLVAALLRMTEAMEGTIYIDGVDISKIGLDDLRTKITVIPQEYHLFSGTIRSNIDPFNEYEDYEIWNALERVQLKEKIESMPQKLSTIVSNDDSDLSVGGKQLFVLARCVLKKSKVIILDEATANVCLETDAAIQKTIREEFADSTILMIAHRLDTIIDADKVLVMDTGRIMEYETPYKLLQNPSSYFSYLVSETGSDTANRLSRIAKKKFSSLMEPLQRHDLNLVQRRE